MTRERLVPLIVAVALFMENMDSTVISTSLPAIAADIGSSPLELKLAITSYLLALAIFIPASGWMADRYGARTIFRTAIAVFMVGSIGCALSHSLAHFVVARFFQGMGGAMMSPVGRLVLIRTVGRQNLVDAMALLTTPALIGPMLGPPLGGFITTYATWHWIFLINLPIGLLGIFLVTRFVENVRADKVEPFDFVGMTLVGLGVGGLAFGLTVTGIAFVPMSVIAALIIGGATATFAYILHARRMPAPVIDLTLFKLQTFRAGVGGGFIFRVGSGALPFLLPLLLQIGFGRTPFQSGLITLSTAVGAMMMKWAVPRILRRIGFRNALTWNALIASLMLMACAAFTATTPVPAMVAVLLLGGFFRSLQFTSLTTLAYADIPNHRTSAATSFSSMMQQINNGLGVAVAAVLLHAMQLFHTEGAGAVSIVDIRAVFVIMSLIALSGVIFYMRLAPDAGVEVSGHRLRGTAEPADAAASD
jgi:EmrB/QacA subfamily drug resistance transporter